MRIYDDHVWINSTKTGEMVFMRSKYFADKLDDLDDFWGFFPRTFLPQSKLYIYSNDTVIDEDDPAIWTKVTLFIIDS